MSEITSALTDLTTLFGVVVVLAVTVVGFFKGRAWLKKI